MKKKRECAYVSFLSSGAVDQHVAMTPPAPMNRLTWSLRVTDPSGKITFDDTLASGLKITGCFWLRAIIVEVQDEMDLSLDVAMGGGR